MHSLGKSFQRSKEATQRSKRAKYHGLVEAQRDVTALLEVEEQQRQQRKGAALKSIWETNDLDEFLLIADAREKGYEAARDLRLVVDGTPHVVTNEKVVPLSDDRVDWLKLSELLTIPRRPAWSYAMSAEQLQERETSVFFDWRRRLSKLEEEHKVVMTPYEKNLEVWRQLWRVVERADVVLMILDARNPLVFRCADFEAYVRTTTNNAGKPKEVIFLLNKSDLLTESQRMAWATYFTERGEKFFFFSSAAAAAKTTAAKQQQHEEERYTQDKMKKKQSTNSDNSDSSEEEEEEVVEQEEIEEEREEEEVPQVSGLFKNKKEKRRHIKKSLRAPVAVANPYELAEQRRAEKSRRTQQQQLKGKQQQQHPQVSKLPETLTAEEKARDARLKQQQQQKESDKKEQGKQKQSQEEEEEEEEKKRWAVLDPEQLLDRLAELREVHNRETPLMVGLVGYPNVGKSSTINAILGCKKVVVSATPGKTKHFQTLVIPNERRVALCDCPGLVFPSFASTRAKMVCDGILPIDTATDALSAVAVVCRRIPRSVLEWHFNISLAAEDDVDDSHSLAERFLNAVARRRGFMGAHDRPNKSRAAREVLKLHVDGALVYAEPPPNYTNTIATTNASANANANVAAAVGTSTANHTVHSTLHHQHNNNHNNTTNKNNNQNNHNHNHNNNVDASKNDEWEDVSTSNSGGSSNSSSYEDYDEDDDAAWDDLDSAADARALSDDGHDWEMAQDEDEDAHNYASNMKTAAAMFYSRPRCMRGTLTPHETFNAEANQSRMALASCAAARRKRRTNHQLEPVDNTFVNDDGEVELIIDDDDGIIEIVGATAHAKDNILPGQAEKEKHKTKRQMRREMRRAGVGPVNPTTRKVGVQGY
ncbi:putative GTP-binding protein [Trypanosoma theileri]|uniref:Putative GTP-binding protein n=1 Tax=Trypanosoma theileri TaxID=67003 RepID=A0A1X0P356_9TRYP|nr:putative GTP-binding protein [Trypanosoma theileri]ORC91133.1 putative GTP-binding protein [Trypanosoma theileri]